MLIHLSDVEQTLVAQLAKLRTFQSRQADLPNERIANLSDATIEREGMAAEWAFCKALNIYPDLFGGPRTHDCVYYGATVDVKSTQYEHGQLIVRPEKIDDPCDYYALVTGTFPGPYVLRGVASKEEIFIRAARRIWATARSTPCLRTRCTRSSGGRTICSS